MDVMENSAMQYKKIIHYIPGQILLFFKSGYIYFQQKMFYIEKM
jgi:hypothetical protein